ncbi:MAG TPA: hypothetical protein VFS62_15850, partial [Chloroflexota bacterium]|nr:hypothetical protein [Chloroflexota bacterium]
MSNIRIESVELPAGAAVVELAVHIMARAESMGLFAPEEPVRVLDQEVLTRVWRALARAGVAREATAGLLAGAALEDGGGRGLLEEVYRALEACPTPEYEWKQLLQVLPVETLAALTDISMSSLRRYA